MTFFEKFHTIFIEKGYYTLMLEGFKSTIIITLGALAIGLVIGTIIAVIKYFGDDNKAMRPLVWLCDLYTTVVRGIPVVVLLLIFFFVIFASSSNGVAIATLTFGINSGAYMAELVRSGLNAVNIGQMEAGRSLGLSKLQTMRKIILPQAIRYILPAIFNELIALLKETSVAGYVAVIDLTRAGTLVRNNTYNAVVPLTLVAVVYLVLVILLTRLLKLLERRLSNNDKRRKS
ncbi:MAG: amino acid ABC transporter permease [Clostridia bacterium]|nr:amino acid ABC transporter permease [Clostridia bacterium]